MSEKEWERNITSTHGCGKLFTFAATYPRRRFCLEIVSSFILFRHVIETLPFLRRHRLPSRRTFPVNHIFIKIFKTNIYERKLSRLRVDNPIAHKSQLAYLENSENSTFWSGCLRLWTSWQICGNEFKTRALYIQSISANLRYSK